MEDAKSIEHPDFHEAGSPLIFGHRGGHVGHPNSVEAIDNAIAAGADGVEIDIQLNAQGQLVARHDIGPDQAGRSPLLLDELLAAVTRTQTKLLIDFKSNGDPAQEAAVLAEALVDFAEPDLIWISSFSVPFLEQFSKLTNRFPLYPIVSSRQNFPRPAGMSAWAGVSVLAAALVVNPLLLVSLRRRKQRLIVWFGVTEWAVAVRAARKIGAHGLVVGRVKPTQYSLGP